MMVLLSALAAEMSVNPGMMRSDLKPPGSKSAGGYRGALNAQAAPASGRGGNPIPHQTSLIDGLMMNDF